MAAAELAGSCAADEFFAAEPELLGGVYYCFFVVALPDFDAGFFEDGAAAAAVFVDPLDFFAADLLFYWRFLRHCTQK